MLPSCSGLLSRDWHSRRRKGDHFGADADADLGRVHGPPWAWSRANSPRPASHHRRDLSTGSQAIDSCFGFTVGTGDSVPPEELDSSETALAGYQLVVGRHNDGVQQPDLSQCWPRARRYRRDRYEAPPSPVNSVMGCAMIPTIKICYIKVGATLIPRL